MVNCLAVVGLMTRNNISSLFFMDLEQIRQATLAHKLLVARSLMGRFCCCSVRFSSSPNSFQ